MILAGGFVKAMGRDHTPTRIASRSTPGKRSSRRAAAIASFTVAPSASSSSTSSCRAGSASTTDTRTLGALSRWRRFGARDEAVDERLEDMAEHRGEGDVERPIGERVIDGKLDAAAVGAERLEPPLPGE